jgi:hypothetical protein
LPKVGPASREPNEEEPVMEKPERLRVVTTGGVLAGFDRAKVVVEFAKLANQPEAVVEQLLAGARHVVKRNIDPLGCDCLPATLA